MSYTTEECSISRSLGKCEACLVCFLQMWTFFYVFNFSVVPKHCRPLASSIMGLTFLVVLSFVAYGAA
jgi:hypothetical protein